MKHANLNILEVVSDTICPWCYVGKRRLERALALPGVPDLQVSWKPFELNPTMPVAGMDRREYRTRKFGSWERSRQLDAKVCQAGAEVGIAFNFESISRTPNTLASHQLLWLAGQHDRQDAVAEGLFQAYFVAGRDIGDLGVLVEVGVSAGLSASSIEEALRDDAVKRAVRSEEERAQAQAVNGVPSFFLGGQLLASGAQHEKFLADALCRSAAALDEAPAEACGLDGVCG